MKLVIFDHSGVLINDLRESWQAISKTVGLRGYKPDELNAFRRNFRLHYWEYLIYKGLTEYEAKDAGVLKDYIRFYIESLEHVKLFDDVQISLSRLIGKGIELVVVSHSPREVVDKVMQKFNLAQYFKRNCVFTLEDYKRQKPHPESIELALKKLGYSTGDAIYVGDMREDIGAAEGSSELCRDIPGRRQLPHRTIFEKREANFFHQESWRTGRYDGVNIQRPRVSHFNRGRQFACLRPIWIHSLSISYFINRIHLNELIKMRVRRLWILLSTLLWILLPSM